MTRPVGLHQISAMEVAPPAFVQLAASAGYDGVSLFTFCPAPVLPGQKSRLVFPTTTPDMKNEIRQRLADNGLVVFGIEFFPITADADLQEYVPGMELGRQLGAKRAVTHIHELDPARAVDRLGLLCQVAARQDLTIAIEFTPMTRGCISLERAVWLIDQVDAPNLGVGIDCLHFVRSAGSVDELARLESRYLSYSQICDGHGLHSSSDYMADAHERELPGKGDFPLSSILGALPPGTPLEVEVPSAKRRDCGGSALAHAREALANVRSLLERVSPRR